MTSGEAHRNDARLETTAPAAGAAAAQDQVIDRSPISGQVTSVRLIPEAALVANATNFRTFRVINKGQAGTGNTVVATLATDTPGTDDLAAFDEKAIPITNPAVAEGDVLAADETVAGTGVAHSGYRLIVHIER